MSSIVEFEDDDEKDDPAALAAAREELLKRCKTAGIPVEEQDGFDGEKYLQIGLPNGREKRYRTFLSLRSITEFLTVPFERYTFVGDYEAICRYDEGSIEALVRGIGQSNMFAIRRHLLRDIDDESQDSGKGSLKSS